MKFTNVIKLNRYGIQDFTNINNKTVFTSIINIVLNQFHYIHPSI